MSHQIVHGRKLPVDFNDAPEYTELLTDSLGRLILSGETELTVSVDDLLNLEATQQDIKTALISINNKTIQVDRETDNAYFAGNLTAGDVTDTIDLGIRTIIQFGGRSDTANFSFVIEYSNDGVIFSTDGFEPELTLVGTQHRFNLTRTNICMRFVRLLCRTSGTNVVIAYSTIQ